MNYEFNRDDAFRFSNHIHANAKQRGEELQFLYCPYCHGGKSRDKGSFSINMNTGQFECKRSSCSSKGNMITLSRDFDFSLSEEIDRYFNRDNCNDRFKKFKQETITVKDEAITYLKSRGISEAICKKYEITTYKDKNNIIVFPFKNDQNELKFIKYRKTDFDKSKDKCKEWCESDCMPILFGMNHCTGFDKLIITEGQIDSLSVAESGIKNAVSVPTGCNGFTWIPHCWDWLAKFDELIVFGDCENGKITLSETLSKRFAGKVKIVRVEDYKGCKDANELLQKHGRDNVVQAVENAELQMIKKVKRLADVQTVDILNMEKIKANVKAVDDLFGGGFALGQVGLLTGKRGDGKSTFMSQLIIEATEQGYGTFVYSGELMDFYFKRWLDMQLSGQKHPSNTTVDRMNAWYYNKIFLYDNNIVDDEEMDDLIKITEEVICRHGVKLICLDNLMTAIEVKANDDLYRAQSRFVGKLAKIAKVHNVLIILVAHPRKTNNSFENDDVSGSADITNKVDFVMSYTRNDKDDDTQRLLKVTKNRLTGSLTNDTTKLIRLFYDVDSKRIVGDDKNFSRVYGWATEASDLFTDADEEEVPF